MIDRRELLISIILGLLFWVAGLLCNKFLLQYYKLCILILIPIIIGGLLSFWLKDLILKKVLFYSAVIVVIREIILTLRTFFLFLGDDLLVKYVKDAFISFLYVGPIQWFFTVFAWILIRKFLGGQKRAARPEGDVR
jgi:hypothetical protein